MVTGCRPRHHRPRCPDAWSCTCSWKAASRLPWGPLGLRHAADKAGWPAPPSPLLVLGPRGAWRAAATSTPQPEAGTSGRSLCLPIPAAVTSECCPPRPRGPAAAGHGTGALPLSGMAGGFGSGTGPTGTPGAQGSWRGRLVGAHSGGPRLAAVLKPLGAPLTLGISRFMGKGVRKDPSRVLKKPARLWHRVTGQSRGSGDLEGGGFRTEPALHDTLPAPRPPRGLPWTEPLQAPWPTPASGLCWQGLSRREWAWGASGAHWGVASPPHSPQGPQTPSSRG